MIDVISVCSKAKEASYSLCGYTSEEKNSILLKIADMLSIAYKLKKGLKVLFFQQAEY